MQSRASVATQDACQSVMVSKRQAVGIYFVSVTRKPGSVQHGKLGSRRDTGAEGRSEKEKEDAMAGASRRKLCKAREHRPLVHEPFPHSDAPISCSGKSVKTPSDSLQRYMYS